MPIPPSNKKSHLYSISQLLLLSLALLMTGCGPSPNPASSNNPLSAYQGKWVIINYWATWCAPCIEEIPELNQLAASHQDKLVVLGVDFDLASGEQRQKNIDKLSISFPVLEQDPITLLQVPRPTVLPSTFILNPDGVLIKTLVGPQTEVSLLAVIDAADAAPQEE